MIYPGKIDRTSPFRIKSTIHQEENVKTKHKFFLFVSFCVLLVIGCSPSKDSFDLIITDGWIVDGSGNPWFKNDVGIKGKTIVQVGSLDKSKAKKIIQAEGAIVAPGFIDVHTHCDRKIDEIPTIDNYALQGVTTVIGGNCGGQPAVPRFHRRDHRDGKRVSDKPSASLFGECDRPTWIAGNEPGFCSLMTIPTTSVCSNTILMRKGLRFS